MKKFIDLHVIYFIVILSFFIIDSCDILHNYDVRCEIWDNRWAMEKPTTWLLSLQGLIITSYRRTHWLTEYRCTPVVLGVLETNEMSQEEIAVYAIL